MLALLGSIVPLQPGEAPAESIAPRSRAELYGSFQELAAQNPAVVTARRIGESWRSQDALASPINGVWAFRIGGQASGKPAVVLIAAQHAREVAGPEVLARVAERLLVDRNADPVLRYALDRVAVWFVPLMNPDGYDEVIAGRVDWRKNVNASYNAPEDAGRPLPEGIGVDLNRNFPFGWGLPAPPDAGGTDWHGAGTEPYMLDYQGPSAASEPETQALLSFLQDVRPEVVVTYHSPLATVVWPWGHRIGAAQDEVPLGSLGRRLAAIYGYRAGQTSEQVGFTTGDIADWSYGAIGALAFGIELDGGFRPDEPALADLTERTYTSLRYLLAGVATGDRSTWPAPRVTALATSTEPLPGGVRAFITATVESTLGLITGTVSGVQLAIGSPTGPAMTMAPVDGGFSGGDGQAATAVDLSAGRHELWVFASAGAARGVPTATVISPLPYQVRAPVILTR